MSEQVRIEIVGGPLSKCTQHWSPEGAGAVVEFSGVVRPKEAERTVAGLDYEAYRPMADQQLRLLAERIIGKHGLLAIQVEHSEGMVATGEISFRLRIASVHRKEALAAMDEFIDVMKQDVPIWKRARFVEERP